MKKTITLLMALALVSSLFAMPVMPKKQVVEKQSLKEQVLQQRYQEIMAAKAKKAPKHQVAKQRRAVRRAPMADATTFTYSSASDLKQTKNGIKVEIATGEGSTDPTYSTSWNQMRVYAYNTIKVSGSKITKVELTCSKQGKKDYLDMTASTGNLVSGGASTDSTDLKTDVWTGDAASVTFTLGSKGQRIIKQIVVTGEGGTGTDTIQITDIYEGDAYYYTYGDENYWDIDIYKAYDYDEYAYTYPEFYISIAANSKTAIAGDCDVYYAGLWTTENDSVEMASGTLTIIYEGVEGVYSFVGEFTDEDGNVYQLNATEVEIYAYDVDNDYAEIELDEEGGGPTPTDTIVVAMNGDIDASSMEFFGYYFYTVLVNAQNDSIQFSADLEPYGASPITTFTEDDGTVEFLINGDTVAFSSMTMTLSEEADTTIANVLIKTEEVAYNLIIKYFVPEAKDTVVVNFENVAQVVKYSDYGMYMIAAEKSDYAFVQAIYTTSLEGEYTEEDMEGMYTGLGTIVGTDTTMLDFFSIDTKIENVNDTFRMVTNYLAKDTIVYQLNMWYTLPEAKDTVDVLIVDAQLLDATADYGAVWANGELPSQNVASFYIYTDSVKGSFTSDDLDADYSYLGIIDGEDTTYVDFLTLDIEISTLDDTTAVVVAQGLGSDEYFYRVTMIAALEVYTFDPYASDETVNVERTFTEGTDITLSWNTDDFEDYGYVLLDAAATDGSEVYMGFYSDTKVIANGVYEINDSQEAPSVEASTGADEEGYIYASLYSENELENIWFLVSGTVTVSDSTIVIDALNSNSNTVNVTINLSNTPPTPGEHTIIFADYCSAETDTAFTTTDGVYTVIARKGTNVSTAPKYMATGEDLRTYAGNTFSLSATSEMTEIVFNISTQGLKRQATITPSTGVMAYDMDNAMVTWTGRAANVTFTVGAKADYGSEGATKAGQFDFTSLDIVLVGTGLNAVSGKEEISKFIYDNQLYIRNNGVLYNAQGQVVK